jgi:hypothetical protein
MSNDSLSKVKDRLLELPTEVKDSVDKSIDKMNEVSQNVESITLTNKVSQDETIKKIQELLSNLDTHISSELKKNNERLDTFNKNLNDLTRKESLSNDTDDTFPSKFYTRLLTNTSYLSLQIICAFDEYKKQKLSVPISISKLLRCFEYNDDSKLELYVFACIIIFASIGVIEYSLVSQNDFDNILVGNIKEDFKVAFIDHFDKTERAVDTRKQLKIYFNELSKDNTDNEDQEQQ